MKQTRTKETIQRFLAYVRSLRIDSHRTYM